jgi:hypothetical protein
MSADTVVPTVLACLGAQNGKGVGNFSWES